MQPDAGSLSVAMFLYEPGDGGLDRVAILMANGLAERGVKTELWMIRNDGPSRALVSSKVTVRIIPVPAIGSRSLQLLLQLPALIRTIRQQRPDVLMSAGNQSNFAITLAAKLAACGTQAVSKITNPMRRPGMGGIRLAVRRVRFGVSAWLGALTMTLSEADARALAEEFPSIASRFRCVHNPYATAGMLAAGQARTETSGAVPKLLSVGRLMPQKDHATMLDALGLLRARPWSLVMLGDGPLGPALAAQAERLGIADRIQFKGFVLDPLPWYTQSRLMILSSRYEGLPAAPIEALACGCSVVTTACSPGLTELMAATRLPAPVPVKDAAALAAAIESALDTPWSPSELSNFALRYSVESAVDDHLFTLRSLIQKHH